MGMYNFLIDFRKSTSTILFQGLYFDVLLNASKTCFPPTIQFPAYNLVETFEGDNLSISCCGEGVPEPVAKWVLPTSE